MNIKNMFLIVVVMLCSSMGGPHSRNTSKHRIPFFSLKIGYPSYSGKIRFKGGAENAAVGICFYDPSDSTCRQKGREVGIDKLRIMEGPGGIESTINLSKIGSIEVVGEEKGNRKRKLQIDPKDNKRIIFKVLITYIDGEQQEGFVDADILIGFSNKKRGKRSRDYLYKLDHIIFDHGQQNSGWLDYFSGKKQMDPQKLPPPANPNFIKNRRKREISDWSEYSQD